MPTPIYDDLVLQQLDSFDPIRCEIVRVCDHRCCRVECTVEAAWVGRWKGRRGGQGVILACTVCKGEVGQALAGAGITYDWSPL